MLRRILSALVVVALSLMPVVGQTKPSCLAASPCGVERMVDAAASASPCDHAAPAKGACDTTDLCLSACAPFVSGALPTAFTSGVHFSKSQFGSIPKAPFVTLTVAPDTGPPRA
jgi:hypothetical protein